MNGDGLSIERHRELGDRLTELNSELVSLQQELADAYPAARGLPARLKDITRQLAGLRDDLDDKVWQEHPTRADGSIYTAQRWDEPD